MERSEELQKKYSSLGLWRTIMWIALFVGGYGILAIPHDKSPWVIAALVIGVAIATVASIKATKIRGEIRKMGGK